MDTRFIAYPFLEEDSMLCDYEIATDELASMIAHVNSLSPHLQLERIVYMVYHANGSLRGKMALHEKDLHELTLRYQTLIDKIGPIDYFVVPGGCEVACALHVLRSKCKAIVRIMVKIRKEEHHYSKLLSDFFQLLSNLFFLMALDVNQMEGVEEMIFHSTSYDS